MFSRIDSTGRGGWPSRKGARCSFRWRGTWREFWPVWGGGRGAVGGAGRVSPRSTLLVGAARLQGERLGIGITSLEHGGNIIPVELEVYDSDGQAGIFIPGSMEIDAAKEIGANMGSSLGSSINISTDAGAQLASDLGRGAIQGISQYISKRMRTVKVHLKSGYRVLLYQEKE